MTVRTIGKVMWSPLMEGVSQNQFTDLAISLARKRLHTPPLQLADEEAKVFEAGKSYSKDSAVAEVLIGTLSTAASVYLEIYPDYAGTASWDTALGGFTRG
jgi:hypothetical protein